MKKHLLTTTFLIILFLIQQLPAQGLLSTDYPLRIVSYNIRFDNPNDRDNVWANRKDRVANVLRFHRADIFCLQEALINQIEDLQQEFPNFEYYGVGRDDGKKGGESCPIFFKASRFKVLDSGTFWLSETPDKAGSTAWYATLPRITSWVKMTDLSSGKEFYVLNTHLDHASEVARKNGSKLIMKKLKEFNTDLPVILTGDFNDRPGSDPYNNIIHQGEGNSKLADAKTEAKYPHHGSTFTYVGWDFIGVPGKIIDYIFVNNKVDVSFHAYLGDNWDGIYPSDHIPVLIELKLK